MARTYSITAATNRSKLSPNKEPYWHKISKGRFVGFRKLKNGGSWIARYKSDRKVIGDMSHMDFHGALESTINYCNLLDDNVQVDYTVQMGVDDYCNDFAIRKNEDGAEGYRRQYNRVLTDELKRTPINKLTTKQLTDWVNSRIIKLSKDPTEQEIEDQRKSKSTIKRDLTQVKAMLSFAYKQGMVSTDVEWKRVKNFTTEVEKARDIFFTDQQVQNIIEEANEPFKAYFKATLLLGTRPGEWADPTVADFDELNRTIHIGRKTGKRDAVLSGEAMAFIKAQVKGKLPKALIFTDNKGNKWKTLKLNREFQRIVKKLKLPQDSVPYCLRHYFISHGMEADVQILLLARNCGTSIKMIEDSYGKFRKSSAIEQLDLIKLAI